MIVSLQAGRWRGEAGVFTVHWRRYFPLEVKASPVVNLVKQQRSLFVEGVQERVVSRKEQECEKNQEINRSFSCGFFQIQLPKTQSTKTKPLFQQTQTTSCHMPFAKHRKLKKKMFLDIISLQQLTHNHNQHPPDLLDTDMSGGGKLLACVSWFSNCHNLHPSKVKSRDGEVHQCTSLSGLWRREFKSQAQVMSKDEGGWSNGLSPFGSCERHSQL